MSSDSRSTKAWDSGALHFTSSSSPSSSYPISPITNSLPVCVHPSLDPAFFDQPVALSSRIPSYTSQFLHLPKWDEMDERARVPRPCKSTSVRGMRFDGHDQMEPNHHQFFLS